MNRVQLATTGLFVARMVNDLEELATMSASSRTLVTDRAVDAGVEPPRRHRRPAADARGSRTPGLAGRLGPTPRSAASATRRGAPWRSSSSTPGTRSRPSPEARARLRADDRLLAATGLRPSELFGFEWRDVDREAGVVYVRRAYANGQLKHTETRLSNRAVPL
jgi:integrase